MKNRHRGCRTGKIGERAAAKLLRSMGFTDARRTEQHTGNAGDSDVTCPESLPDIFIEVKNTKAATLGGEYLDRAMALAASQAFEVHQTPVILWNERSKGWRLYCYIRVDDSPILATFTGIGNMRHVPLWLQSRKEASK